MNPIISLAMSWLVSLLFFYKDGFGIKYHLKVDIPLNKQKDILFCLQIIIIIFILIS